MLKNIIIITAVEYVVAETFPAYLKYFVNVV